MIPIKEIQLPLLLPKLTESNSPARQSIRVSGGVLNMSKVFGYLGEVSKIGIKSATELMSRLLFFQELIYLLVTTYTQNTRLFQVDFDSAQSLCP